MQNYQFLFCGLVSWFVYKWNTYNFSSVEIKQTAFRIDGVFLPTPEYDSPIYFVEVQFQPDSEFSSRFFAEIFLYLRQNKPQNNWCAVVLYPTQSVDTGDIKHYIEFFTSQRVSRIYLDELGGSAEQSIGIGTVNKRDYTKRKRS